MTEMTKPKGRKLQNVLTALVALIATGVQAQGMWQFFGDKVGIDDWRLRVAMFAFLELALLVCALRARRYRIDTGRKGFDDALVWMIAILGGTLAASDAHGWGAFARFIAPLVAAILFERAISAERKDRTGNAKKIHWKISLERLAVTLRLADAVERTMPEIDQRRTLARLAKVAFRSHEAKIFGRFYQWQLRRGIARANERLGLAVRAELVEELRRGIALQYEVIEATTREAVKPTNPWTVPVRPQVDSVRTDPAGRPAVPVRVPAIEASATPANPVLAVPVRGTAPRTDEDIKAILLDPEQTPRAADGTVSIGQARKSAGAGSTRAKKLLDELGLLVPATPVAKVNGTSHNLTSTNEGQA